MRLDSIFVHEPDSSILLSKNVFFFLIRCVILTVEYKETDWVKNGERVKVRRFPTKKPGSGIRYRLKQKQSQRYIADVISLFAIFKNKIIVIPIAWLSCNFSFVFLLSSIVETIQLRDKYFILTSIIY